MNSTKKHLPVPSNSVCKGSSPNFASNYYANLRELIMNYYL